MKNNNSTIYNQEPTRPGNNNITILGNDTAVPGTSTINHSRVDSDPVADVNNTIPNIYRIESEPVVGGFGRVFRVHHTGWNADLAMKQPKRDMFQTEQQKENFTAECRYWINLGLHPHIVSCYYVREIDGIPSIFAEWMDGGNLKERIYPKDGEENGILYEGSYEDISERILDISIQVARGLYYANEQGLIHQDIKPENLLLTPEGTAKVADFGIANAMAKLDIKEGHNITGTGTILSKSGVYTKKYRSPEQASGNQLTHRTDIWSWAVSVLEMFIGDRPWMDGTVAGTACEKYFEMARVPMSEAMKDLLRYCFRKNESQRPHDFKEIETILLKIYRDLTGKVYSRIEPKAAANTADSLNNKALSFLDLGKLEEAEKCWKEAQQINYGHEESLFNHALFLWRNGKIDDLRALATLDNVPDASSWKVHYYRALIHLERGDPKRARFFLREAQESGGDEAELEETLNDMKGMYEKNPVEKFEYRHNQKNPAYPDSSTSLPHFNTDELSDEIIENIYDFDPGTDNCYEVPNKPLLLITKYDTPIIRILHIDTQRILRSFNPAVVNNENMDVIGPLYMEDTDRIKAKCFRMNGKGNFLIFDIPPFLWQNDWKLCKIQETTEVLHHEELFRKKLNEAEIAFRNNQIGEALDILQNARIMPGFQREGTWTELFTQVTKYCRKKQLLGLQRSSVFNAEGHAKYFELSPDGKRIFACEEYSGNTTKECDIRVIDTETGKLLQTIPTTGGAFALSPDGNSLAYRCDGKLCVLNLETGKEISSMCESGKNNVFPAMAFHPNGKLLATDNRIFDVINLDASGKSVNTASTYIVFSPDGKYLINTNANDAINVFDYSFGVELHQYSVKDGGIPCFSPNGNHLLTCNTDKRYVDLQIFELKRRGNFSNDRCDRFDTNGTYSGVACYSGDGNYMLTAVSSNIDHISLIVYDVRQRVRLQSLTFPDYSHGDVIRFSFDDKFAISAGEQLIRWDFDWEYEFPGWADWDEKARYCLKNFLVLFPQWTNKDFEHWLIPELQRRGFGWLNRNGIYKELMRTFI